MSKAQVHDEIGKIVACLLVSKKESCTIQDLERDFCETEGRALPWRELGYISSFDLLRNLPKYVRIIQQNGQCIVAPVVTEKIRHVDNMVARQRSSKPKKNSHGRRRAVSQYIPRLRKEPRLFIPNDLQTQITKHLLQHPNGMSKNSVLQLFRHSIPSVTMDNIDCYLHAMSSTATVYGYKVYPHRDLQRSYGSSLCNTAQPITNSNSAIDTAGPTSLQQTWTEMNQNEPKPVYPSNISVCPAGSEEGGNLDGDIEFDDEDEFDYVSPVDYPTENRNYLPGSENFPRESKEDSSIPQFDQNNASELTKALVDLKTDENDNLQEEKYVTSHEEYSNEQDTDPMNETYLSDDDTSHIINPRTKNRLQELIQKHPEGIWCADLLSKFFNEYKVNLDFMELGFGSVCELASVLTDVFHCIRLDDMGDFILYDATKPVPQPSTSQRRAQSMPEWVHQLNDDTDDDMYAIPMNLPLYTSQRLIPNNVLAQGESVGQERIPEETCLEVLVAEVYTPSLFWIQFRRKKNKLQNLMESMQAFYEKEGDNYVIPSVVLEKGLNCACMYDNEWHRAIIRTVRPDGRVELIFYDYGTIQTNPSEALRFLHRYFSNLPAQAIAACAYNIRPVTGDRWTRTASCAFLRKVSNIPLVAMTVEISHETNTMQVSLVDTRKAEDVHINDWMVAKKFARYGSMVRTRPNNFVLRHYLECEMNKCQKEAERLKLKNSTIKLHLESLDASYCNPDNSPKSNMKTMTDLKQLMAKYSKYKRNDNNNAGESSTSVNAKTAESSTKVDTNMNYANTNYIENESLAQSAVHVSHESENYKSNSIESNSTNSKGFDENGTIKHERINKTCPDQSTSKIRQCAKKMTCDPLQNETKNVNDNIKNNNHERNDVQSRDFGTFRSRYGGHGLAESIDWSKIRQQISLPNVESPDLVVTKSESTTTTDSSCYLESTTDKFGRPTKSRALIDNLNVRDVGQVTLDSPSEEIQKKNQGDKIDMESRFIEDDQLEVKDDAEAIDNEAGSAVEDAGAATNDANPTEDSTDFAQCNGDIAENNTNPRDNDGVSPLWALGIEYRQQDQLKPPPGFAKLTEQRNFTDFNEIFQNMALERGSMNNDNSQNIYQCNSNPFLSADMKFESMPVSVQTMEQTWNQQLPLRDVLTTTTKYNPYSANSTPDVSQINLHNLQIGGNDSELLQDTITNPFQVSYWNNGQSLENSIEPRKLQNSLLANENINECPPSDFTFGDTLQYLQRDSTAFEINEETLSSSMPARETTVDESYKNLANLTLDENRDTGLSNPLMNFLKQFTDNSKNPCTERLVIDVNHDAEKNLHLNKDTDAILSADANNYTNDVSLNGTEQDNNVNWKNIINDEKKSFNYSANLTSTNQIETECNENKINRLSQPQPPQNPRLINKFHKIDVNRIKEIKNNKIYYKGDPVMHCTKTTPTDKNNEEFVQTIESSVEKTKCNPSDTSGKYYSSSEDVVELDASKSKALIGSEVKTMPAKKIVTIADPKSGNVSSMFAKQHNIHTSLLESPTKNSDHFNWTLDPVTQHNSAHTLLENFYSNRTNHHCSEISANDKEYSPRFSYHQKSPVSPRFVSPDMTDASKAAIKLVELATDFSTFDELTSEASENVALTDTTSNTSGKQRLGDTIVQSDHSQEHASCAVSVEDTIPDVKNQLEKSYTNLSQVVLPILSIFPEESVKIEGITSNESLGNVDCNEHDSTENLDSALDTMKINNNTSTDNVTNSHKATDISTKPSNKSSISSEANQQQHTDDRYVSIEANVMSPTNVVYHYPAPTPGCQYAPPLYHNSLPMNYIPTFPHPCPAMPVFQPPVNECHNLNQGIPLYPHMIPGFSPVRNNWPNQWIPMPCFIPASVPPPTPSASEFVQPIPAINVCDRPLRNSVTSDPNIQVDPATPYNVPKSYARNTAETQPRTLAPLDTTHLLPQGRKASANVIKNNLTPTTSAESTPRMMRKPPIHSNVENHTSSTGFDNFINLKCASECTTDGFITSTEPQQSQGSTEFVSGNETASSVQQESISSAKSNRSTSPQLEPTDRDLVRGTHNSINPKDSSNGVQNAWFKQVETSHGAIFIINWDKKGWVCTDEIVSAFTSFQSREVILRLVTLLHLKINFETLNRCQSPDLFSQLDGTTLQLPRMANSNRIIGSLHLTPLKSLVRLLINVKVISDQEIHDLARQKKLPSGSTLLEIMKLLEAYEDAKKCWGS